MNTTCKICNAADHENPITLFDSHETESFLKQMHEGLISARKLSYDMYLKTARKLTKGVHEGFGNDLMRTTYGSPDYQMLHSMRENVYIFSAAKTYQQTKELTAMLYDKGKLKSFADFKKEALPRFDEYNNTYMTVEYNSAVMQARSASQWMDIERDMDLYDQLEYHTVGDSRVRPEHQILNGTIRPVKDKFWDVYFPPNGWSCRCTVLQVTGEKNSDLRTMHISKRDVPPIFRFNPGKEKIVFSKEHPYFNVARKDKEFAKKNFGLPLPR